MSRLWVADDGKARVQRVVNASLAADHRVSDGHRGAKFLVELQQVLQRPETLESTRALRTQVDLDSMDWLNFLISLHGRFGVNIPESDYAQLVSLDDVVDYLQARLDRP